MNPEDRVLLERTLKLSEDNNRILHKMQRAAKWATLWWFIKMAIIVVPLVFGYIYLQPFFDQIRENYSGIQELFNSPR